VTWNELVSFRESNPKTVWTQAQKRIVLIEAKQRKAIPGVTGVAIAMAAELGITVKLLNDRIRESNTAGKREAARSKSA
jgi:hypothetical protein